MAHFILLPDSLKIGVGIIKVGVPLPPLEGWQPYNKVSYWVVLSQIGLLPMEHCLHFNRKGLVGYWQEA